MQFPLLVLLILVTWIIYPVAGAIGVAASKADGTSPDDAGFSFLPELLFFPTLSIAVAYVLDRFFFPVGSCVIGGLSVLLVIWMTFSSARNLRTIARHRKTSYE